MKINVVSIEDSLISVGVRKVSAHVRRLNRDTTPYYVPLGNFRSLRTILRARYASGFDPQHDALTVAEPIADADIVAFSSMTHMAAQTKAIIAQVRRISPAAYIIWGGIHPIIVPEDAIEHADAVCTGEGEFAFEEFFDSFRAGRDYTRTRNFWFRHRGTIIRNEFRPLMTSVEMDSLPLPTYGRGESVFDWRRHTFRPTACSDYINYIGLAYNTVWTIGCPFRCTYCGNTKFLDNDRAYTRLRHASCRRVVDEIKAACSIHPHITGVVFHDDSFLALPTRTLQEFAALYKAEVGLPFCVLGVIPNYVRREKIEILLDAGLNRVRMGIQSGSRRILDFYKRPSPPEKILEAANTLADYAHFMIPPAYDIIVDNPIETRKDVVETLKLAYELGRPYTLNIFSLRVMPNTDLVKQFRDLGVSVHELSEDSYRRMDPTAANCLLVLLALVKPPRRLFRWLLRRAAPMTHPQSRFPRLLFVLRLLFFIRRAWDHMRFMDFSVLPGRSGWVCWRVGIVAFWRRHLVPKFERISPSLEAAPSGSLQTLTLPVLLPGG